MSKEYYVYSHQDPETNEIVYIGHGRLERAWICRKSAKRSGDHARWMQELSETGLTPNQWVYILEQALDKTKACELERFYIDQCNPIFNNPFVGAANLKMTNEILREAYTLRQQGLTYTEISKIVKFDRMSLWRALNGHTKFITLETMKNDE